VLVQLRTRTPAGTGLRSFTLLRRAGRFVKRPAYVKRSACVFLRSFTLGRPVFGGTTRRQLGVSVRMRGTPGRVRITLRRGGKVVRTLAGSRRLGAGKRIRLRVRPRGLGVAAYRVRVDVRAAGKRRAAVLTARRL
jgi:hypothetical protein